MMENKKNMYLGVDYYPEQWDAEFLEQDLARMVSAGVNCIRIAEFAWHLMEPREGQFSFDYFTPVLDRAEILWFKSDTLFGWKQKLSSKTINTGEYRLSDEKNRAIISRGISFKRKAYC